MKKFVAFFLFSVMLAVSSVLVPALVPEPESEPAAVMLGAEENTAEEGEEIEILEDIEVPLSDSPVLSTEPMVRRGIGRGWMPVLIVGCATLLFLFAGSSVVLASANGNAADADAIFWRCTEQRKSSEAAGS